MSLVLQFLVLGFTVVVWWLARRDLTRHAIERHTPAVQEWEQLQETVEMLIADLERRATHAEQRVAEAERRLEAAERRLEQGIPAAAETHLPSYDLLRAPEPSAPGAGSPPTSWETEDSAHDARYAPVYALADSGVSDLAEIARRTGLGQGEVGLILSLRARRSSG